MKTGDAASGLVPLPPGIVSDCTSPFVFGLRAQWQRAVADHRDHLSYIETFQVHNPRALPALANALTRKLTAAGFTVLAYNRTEGGTHTIIRATPSGTKLVLYQVGQQQADTDLALARHGP